jgi:hypothetical protein
VNPRPEAPDTRRAWLKVAGFCIGAALFAGALWSVAREGDTLSRVWDAIRGAPPWLILAALLLPLLDLLITSAAFWVLTRRFGRVGYAEMSALIGAAWLLNHLPLRPGLFGRVAYHKTVNNIRVRDSARVVFENLACNAAGMLIVLLSTLTTTDKAWGVWAGVLAAVLTAGVVFAAGLGAKKRWKSIHAWSVAIMFRIVDMIVWTVRYLVVFRLAGQAVTPLEAAAIATVGQFAMLVPLAGNGLGLREWAVALLASVLPSWFGREAPTVGAGLSADLINRCAELVIAVPTGLLSVAWLAGRRASAHKP